MNTPLSALRRVWVVETWMRGDSPRWFPFDARVSRDSAWALAREDRKKWPREKFRVVPYRSEP